MKKLRFSLLHLQVMAVLAVLCLSSCGPKEATPFRAESPAIDTVTLLKKGENIYTETCAICHFGGDGGGQNPNLLASEIVKGPTEGLLKVIIKGQNGISFVNGKKLNGFMPPQSLSDSEVAAVATFVRREFGKVEKDVQPSEVGAFRQKVEH